jgi:hypothetical protein
MTTIGAEIYHRFFFIYTPTVLFGSFFDQVQSDPLRKYGVLEANAVLTTSKTQYLTFDNFLDWEVWADYSDVSTSEKQRMLDLFNSL